MERDETPGYVFPGALVPQSFLVFPAIYSRTAGAYPGFLPETVGGFRLRHLAFFFLPDLSSNCYSRGCLEQTHLNCPPYGRHSYFP
jgi:hypothetical protein